MIFTPTPLAGSYILDIEPKADERGFFARTFCRSEFEQAGLHTDFPQCSLSYNKHRGIIRGMHYQKIPYSEVKIVRCIRGAIWDVVIDLRKSSPTYLQWHAIELSESNYKALYIPQEFAHGFQALLDDSIVEYFISEPFQSDYQGGIRWSDPRVGIKWPLPDPILSARDQTLPGVEP